MKSKNELISLFARNEEDKILLASVMDKEYMARERGIPAFTRFLSPEQQSMCEKLLCGMKAEYTSFGGFDEAERKIICFIPDYLDESWISSEDGPIAAVRAVYKGDKILSHRDFLGSLMGTGIVREAVGDILTNGNSCDFFVMRELLPFVMQNMTSAGRASLSLSQIAVEEIVIPEAKFVLKRITVMSMRLDGVVAAIWDISRDSAAGYVSSGRINVNHLEATKGDAKVSEGDVITGRGLGKAQIAEANGVSRRGRIVLNIKKYV